MKCKDCPMKPDCGWKNLDMVKQMEEPECCFGEEYHIQKKSCRVYCRMKHRCWAETEAQDAIGIIDEV